MGPGAVAAAAPGLANNVAGVTSGADVPPVLGVGVWGALADAPGAVLPLDARAALVALMVAVGVKMNSAAGVGCGAVREAAWVAD